MQTSRVLVPLICLSAAVALGLWIKQSTPQAAQGKPTRVSALYVETQAVALSDFQVSVPSFGRVDAQRRGEIHALVSGQVQYVSPQFKAGASVQKGQVLLRLDQSEYALAEQVAQSDLANAELTLADELARSEQAARDWAKQGNTTPPSDYALRKPQLKAARASLETAKARLDMARLNLARCEVKASFTGRLQETFVDAGSVVSPGASLARGYETDAAEVRLAVNSRSLRYLRLPEYSGVENASEVTFTNSLVDPPETWQGVLVRSEAAMDADSQQLSVVARIDRPFEFQSDSQKQSLKLAQYLQAQIHGKRLNDVVVIPNSTIYQGRYVYVAERDTLQRKDVAVLWQDETQSVIASGLAVGEALITTPLGQVSSGTRIEIVAQDNAQPTEPDKDGKGLIEGTHSQDQTGAAS